MEKLEARKQCSHCRDYKKLSEFYKEKAKPLGVQSRCRPCKHILDAQYREEQKEKASNSAALKGETNETSTPQP